MTSAHLRQVDKHCQTDLTRVKVERDFQAMKYKAHSMLSYMQESIAFAWGILMFPFRAIRAVWMFLVNLGISLFRGFFMLCFAGVAFAAIGSISFIVYQTVTHWH